MADKGGYIGRNPGDAAVIIARQNYSPTGIQTDFTFNSGYTPGYVDVYLNGVRLIDVQDYTASTGNTVGLTSYANSGDIVEIIAYKAFNVGNVSDATSNFTVGGNLTVSGDSVVSGGSTFNDIIVTGVSTINGASYLADVTELVSSGIVTVTNTTDSTSTTTGALQVRGGVGVALSMTVGGSLSVGGTITYEDVTNQDVIGLSTFRNGVQFGVAGVGGTIDGVGNAIISGITTVGTALSLADDVRAKFGNDGDLEIYHTGSESHVQEKGTGGLIINGSVVTIKNAGDSETIARFTENGGVDLNFDNSTKFATHNTGVKVTGIATISSDLNVAGITTVGILTAYSNVAVGVGATIHGSSGNAVFAGIVTATTLKYGTTSVETAIDAKASTGKAIAMAMVFGF